jgi:hypothetical protein
VSRDNINVNKVVFLPGALTGKDLLEASPAREKAGSSSHYKQTELIISQ